MAVEAPLCNVGVMGWLINVMGSYLANRLICIAFYVNQHVFVVVIGGGSAEWLIS